MWQGRESSEIKGEYHHFEVSLANRGASNLSSLLPKGKEFIMSD